MGSIVAIFAILFGVSAVISHGSTKVFVIGVAIGAFCGVAGLPYLDKKRWQENTIRDLIAGVLAALVIAHPVNAPCEGYLPALLLGAIAGFFGETIAKNVCLP